MRAGLFASDRADGSTRVASDHRYVSCASIEQVVHAHVLKGDVLAADGMSDTEADRGDRDGDRDRTRSIFREITTNDQRRCTHGLTWVDMIYARDDLCESARARAAIRRCAQRIGNHAGAPRGGTTRRLREFKRAIELDPTDVYALAGSRHRVRDARPASKRRSSSTTRPSIVEPNVPFAARRRAATTPGKKILGRKRRRSPMKEYETAVALMIPNLPSRTTFLGCPWFTRTGSQRRSAGTQISKRLPSIRRALRTDDGLRSSHLHGSRTAYKDFGDGDTRRRIEALEFQAFARSCTTAIGDVELESLGRHG